MNRNNIWIHIGLATVLIVFAAVLGQIERWKTALNTPDTTRSIRKVEQEIEPTTRVSSAPEVLVRFKPGVTLEQIRAIATANNDALIDEIEAVNGLTVVDDLDNAPAQTVAAQYSLMSHVAYAEPNFQIRLDEQEMYDLHGHLFNSKQAIGVPSDPLFGQQWALQNLGENSGKQGADLDALHAWETTKGSEDVVVAVLDSGVDYNHVDLMSNMWTRPANVPAYLDDELGAFNDINGYDANAEIRDPMDDNGHGTHCAGIIGAEGDNGEGIAGINWNVKIMPLKFLGRGGMGSANDAIEAINYAIDRKKNGVNVRVISASWGSTSKSKALEDTIRAAGDAGILFVAAAGNDGSDNDRRPYYPSGYDLPNVISVAALDRTDNLASFSNYGVKAVHVAAPGKAIVSTWLGNDYREASGTSMAAPYVSGVAALIIANEPNITMKNLRTRIVKTADKIDSLDGKVVSAGRICAANALGNIVKSNVHN
ncbi:MAG: S8 family serine peptidase [Pyrinomonadaceae bacterium]